LILPKPPGAYASDFFDRVFNILARADDKSVKRDQDIEVGLNRIILTSANGTRYALVVSNAGVLSTSAV
jgi:hypothetical protein